MICVQKDDFNLGDEYQKLIADTNGEGAVVTFVGLVRDFNQDSSVHGLFLEHYPGMTEKSLLDIVMKAKLRWDLGKVSLIHRVGQLTLSEQIVFVGVTSKHRESAFQACQFIMDFLKNDAPFWKKEMTDKGQKWVEFNEQDKLAAKRW